MIDDSIKNMFFGMNMPSIVEGCPAQFGGEGLDCNISKFGAHFELCRIFSQDSLIIRVSEVNYNPKNVEATVKLK